MYRRVVRLLSCLVLPVMLCESAKILLLTGPTYSHCAEVSGVGHSLLDRGHSVFILLGSTFEHKNCFDKGKSGDRGIQPIITTDSPHVMPPSEIAKIITSSMVGGKDFSFFSHLSLVRNFSRTPCTNMFYDKVIQARLVKEKFDLVIVDSIPFSYCFFMLPVKLGVPYVAMSSVFEDFVTDRPFVPSIVPSQLMDFTDSMDFFQRLMNTANFVAFHLLGRFSQAMDVINQVDPDMTRQGLVDLAAKCELYLHNYDTILSYPVPQMPNHVFIGGIGAGPSKPLPAALEQFFEASSKDIVVVTFGSNVGNMPTKTNEALERAFRRLNANILWKNDIEGEDGNVRRMKWLPQNDLLGNSKTKVFVSHCGNNGVFEALYHGVPLVCTPIFGDQFYNGKRIQRWNVGKSLPLLTASTDEIYDAINAVLTDPVYSRNMKRASEMYHNQPMTARERAAFWVEYVLKYGGGHLRSRASEMSTFAYMGYDVLCFVLALVLLVIIFTWKCISVVCRCLCWRTAKPKTD